MVKRYCAMVISAIVCVRVVVRAGGVSVSGAAEKHRQRRLVTVLA
jgi:hypothetical protein